MIDDLKLLAHNVETALSNAESADADQEILDALAEASAAADRAVEIAGAKADNWEGHIPWTDPRCYGGDR